ncbi:centromere protein F-like [Elgaria multicarinata webbii]|uniref:centromere protein F-like n=1 Tax=Elgaria multicarinata webbii TaxID=159646 RepID=UPI002FCD28E5
MSWPGEEWKVGLPARALRAITEVEQRLERLQKERQQKQVQLDTLEAMMHKQRQKHEEERTSWVLLSQQNRSLTDACEQMERGRQRLVQELQAKETQLSCLKAQLAQATRRQAELEEELRRCQLELEKLQSQSHPALPPPRWGSPTPWAEGGVELKAEPSKSLEAGANKIQRSTSALGGPWEKEIPQQGMAWPGALPGNPVPTENGEEARSLAAELASAGERLKKDNQELRLALAKAETRTQEKERELWNMQGQLELTRAELAQWKKQRGGQAEVAPPENRGRRLSEDVGAHRRSRDQQKGLLGLERVPSGGSRRSVSSSRLEQLAEKRGAPSKQKGFALLSPRAPSTEQGPREELQALRAEVLTLQRRLDASESQRKSLLETCWQQQKPRAWAQEGQGPLNQQRREGSQGLQGDGQAGFKERDFGKGEDSVAGKVEGSGGASKKELEEKSKLRVSEVEESRAGTDILVPLLAEADGFTEPHVLARGTADAEGKPEPERNVEALREDLRILAAGKAKAEAQAGLAQQKLQSLQATLGRQTERLAEAMETQSHHVEELLADVEEKDRIMNSLRWELEDARKDFDMANAKAQRLRTLLGQRAEEPHGASPTHALEMLPGSDTTEVPVAQAQDDGRAEHPQGKKEMQLGVQDQLENFLAQLLRENQTLREELAHWKTREREGVDALGPLESVSSRNSGEVETVLEATQKREPLLQGNRRNVQTQTEDGHRRRERVSVAFDDTQYEPYGLPEVVMKGFADIPSGPSCPYVLRRGILGSAPVAQLAPRAEPEEDSPEVEEGTGV